MEQEQLQQVNSTCSAGSVLHGVVVPVVFSVVVLLGLFGNVLVITVIVANRHMRSSTNILIMSLAVADLLFIIFCVPLTALFYVFGWVFGHAACVAFQYFTYVPVYASVYTLVLMSADRYLAVVHAIRSLGWRTQRNAATAVALTWLCIGLGHLPFVKDVGVVTVGACRLQQQQRNCSRPSDCVQLVRSCANRRFLNSGGEQSDSGRLFYTLFNLFGYLLPFCVIITLYALLLRQLMCGRTARLSQSTEAARGKRRVTRMVVIVVVIFGTCWLPINGVFALQSWYGDVDAAWFRLLQVVSQVLAYVNSCVNPILYAFLSDNFRQAFAKLLGIRLQPRPAAAAAARPAGRTICERVDQFATAGAEMLLRLPDTVCNTSS